MSVLPSLGTVFLTGGTGSFGRAFLRHVFRYDLADRVISCSRNAEMRYRLEQDVADPRLLVVPGDVRLRADLDAAYDGHIDTVIHAAAEKHVTTGERHEHYVRSINVGGAQQVIAWAQDRRVDRVVALSTDKACAPATGYGRSKADAEKLFVHASQLSDHARFAVVRYGNVVGSSGSVIPLFIRQRRAGVLTITDRRMTRYFMPLAPDADLRVYQEPDARPVISAVDLVLYAFEHMHGGETFIPQIPSGTIQNLAEALGPDCRIEEVGIRPAEKIHEELIAASESARGWRTRDGLFVLMPSPQDVPSMPADRVPEGFRYTSADQPLPLRFEEGQPV